MSATTVFKLSVLLAEAARKIESRRRPCRPAMRSLLLALLPASAHALACGEATLTPLTHGGLSREYFIRPPREPCNPQSKLPLLVLIHCYGCTAEIELRKYARAADAHGFALAVPEGYDSSWNAPHCCGPARERDLDDVGFIDAVVVHASGLLSVSEDSLFAAGFSNGGFLTSPQSPVEAEPIIRKLLGLAPLGAEDAAEAVGEPEPEA